MAAKTKKKEEGFLEMQSVSDKVIIPGLGAVLPKSDVIGAVVVFDVASESSFDLSKDFQAIPMVNQSISVVRRISLFVTGIAAVILAESGYELEANEDDDSRFLVNFEVEKLIVNSESGVDLRHSDAWKSRTASSTKNLDVLTRRLDRHAELVARYASSGLSSTEDRLDEGLGSMGSAPEGIAENRAAQMQDETMQRARERLQAEARDAVLDSINWFQENVLNKFDESNSAVGLNLHEFDELNIVSAESMASVQIAVSEDLRTYSGM